MADRKRPAYARMLRTVCLVFLAFVLAGSLGFTPAAAAASQGTISLVSHRVVSGDTLWVLARRYGTTVSAIANASGISPDSLLRLGMLLKIPSKSAGESAPAPASSVITHRVVSGDSLWVLAGQYHTTVNAIASASGIDPEEILRLGMVLKIPGKPAAPATTAAAKPDTPAAPAAVTTTAATPSAPAPPATTAASTGTPATSAAATATAATGVAATAIAAQPPGPLASRGDGRGAVAIPWAEVDKIYPRGATATVTDVNTGTVFQMVRRGGWAHADVEPKTKTDTAAMKKTWVTWSWTRRPVVVVYGEYRIAASMAGMPHGGEYVTNNGVLGHVDLHFLNSTTHGSSYTQNRRPTLDPQHQACVKQAVGK